MEGIDKTNIAGDSISLTEDGIWCWNRWDWGFFSGKTNHNFQMRPLVGAGVHFSPLAPKVKVLRSIFAFKHLFDFCSKNLSRYIWRGRFVSDVLADGSLSQDRLRLSAVGRDRPGYFRQTVRDCPHLWRNNARDWQYSSGQVPHPSPSIVWKIKIMGTRAPSLARRIFS